MDIEYYVFDKMSVQSEKVEVAIEIMRSLSMYKDLLVNCKMKCIRK